MKLSIPKLTKREGRHGYFIRIKNPATGKRTWKSLGTNDIKAATKEAERVYGELFKLQDDAKAATRALDKTAKRNNYSTVGEIIEVYEKDKSRACAQKTAKQNTGALKLLLAGAGYKNPEKVRLDSLTAKAVRKFRDSRLDPLDRDSEEYDSAVISCNGVYRQAKSIFSKAQLAGGAYDELKLPDLTEFLGVPHLAEEGEDYSFIGVELFSKLINDTTRLANEDPELYAAFLIASTTGLRKNEIIHARWDWLKLRPDGVTVIDIPAKERFEGETFRTKSRKGRQVPIADGVIQELRRLNTAIGYRPDYLLATRGVHARKDRIWRRFNAWFKACGVDRKKPAHECRKFFGSQVATYEGIYVACKLLGHSSVDVTEKYYADLVKPAPVPRVALPPHLEEQQVQKISAS